jgi:hypothetical protein
VNFSSAFQVYYWQCLQLRSPTPPSTTFSSTNVNLQSPHHLLCPCLRAFALLRLTFVYVLEARSEKQGKDAFVARRRHIESGSYSNISDCYIWHLQHFSHIVGTGSITARILETASIRSSSVSLLCTFSKIRYHSQHRLLHSQNMSNQRSDFI